MDALSGFLSGGTYHDDVTVDEDGTTFRNTLTHTVNLLAGTITSQLTEETWDASASHHTRLVTDPSNPGGPSTFYEQYGEEGSSHFSFTLSHYPTLAARQTSQPDFWQSYALNTSQSGSESTTTETWNGSPDAWPGMTLPRTRITTYSISNDGGDEITLFGKTFVAGSSSHQTTTDTQGGFTSTENTRSFQGLQDNHLHVSQSSVSDRSPPTQTSISGWDPDIGSFSALLNHGQFNDLSQADWNALAWLPRQDPTFAPAQLWLNGLLLAWQSGTLTSAGTVTDLYSDPASGLTLSIQAPAPDFHNGTPAVIHFNNASIGSIDHSETISLTGGHSLTLEASGHTHSHPFFLSASTLWLNGNAYPFHQGFSGDGSARLDVYRNANTGFICLSGTTTGTAQVIGRHGSQTFHGTLADTSFSLSHPFVITLHSPYAAHPDAFWIQGRAYHAASPGAADYHTADQTAPGSLTITLADGLYHLSGSDAACAFAGAIPGDNSPGLIHTIPAAGSSQPPQPLIVLPLVLDQNQALNLVCTPNTPAAGLPPAIYVEGEVFIHVGLIPLSSGAPQLLYARRQQPHLSPRVLWLHPIASSQGAHTVTVQPGSPDQPASHGAWRPATRLFQTAAPGTGFPFPIHAVCENDAAWRLSLPADYPHPLPPSFIVRGQNWWYAGLDAQGNPLYHGFFEGQVLQLSPNPALPSQLLVTLTDPVHNAAAANPSLPAHGAYNDTRGSIRLRDGTVIFSGTDAYGVRQLAGFDNQHRLHTITADLDILGNTLSFGLLQGDASLAGTVFQFSDELIPGSNPAARMAGLHSILSRPQAEWQWWKTGANPDAPPQPVMRLDDAHRLRLHDPAGTAPDRPGISLNPGVNQESTLPGRLVLSHHSSAGTSAAVLTPAPDGISSLPGTLRVRPGGDLSMGPYTAGGQP